MRQPLSQRKLVVSSFLKSKSNTKQHKIKPIFHKINICFCVIFLLYIGVREKDRGFHGLKSVHLAQNSKIIPQNPNKNQNIFSKTIDKPIAMWYNVCRKVGNFKKIHVVLCSFCKFNGCFCKNSHFV